MFAQAISSTAATTPPSSHATDCICCRPASPSSIRRNAIFGGVSDCGSVLTYAAADASSAAFACSRPMPDLSRPTPNSQLLVGCLRRSGFCSPE